jgi:hypothetical protein
LTSIDSITALPATNIFLDGAFTSIGRNLARNAQKIENIDSSLNRIFQRSIQVPHPTLFSSSTQIDYRNNYNYNNSRIISDPTSDSKAEDIQVMNRNARRPKKANKGARPCSRASRRSKKEKIGKRKR